MISLLTSQFAAAVLVVTGTGHVGVSHWMCADADYWNSSCWDDGIPTDAGEGGSIDWDNFGIPYTVTFSGSVTVATMALAHPDARWFMEDSEFNPAFAFNVGQGSLMTAVDSSFIGQTGVYTNNGTSLFQGDCFIDLQDIVQNDLMIVKGGQFLQERTLTVQNGFHNNATLSLENATGPASASVRLDVLDGVLTNSGIILLNTETTFDEAHLRADVENLGAIIAHKEAFIDKLNGTHVNESIIEVREDALLTIADASMLRNTGDIQLLGTGSVVEVVRSLIDNTGGTVLASGENAVFSLVEAATVRGGTIMTVGTARAAAERDLINGDAQIVEGLTLDGVMDVKPGAMLLVRSGLTNLGRINLASPNAGSSSRLQFDADATIVGGEILTEDWDFLSGSLTNVIESIEGEHLLTLDDATVHGMIRLGNNTLGVVNRGLVASDVAGPDGLLIVDPSDTLGFDNTEGQLVARNGATLELHDGPYANTGSAITAEDESFIEFKGGNITGGALSTDGTGNLRVVPFATLAVRDLTITDSIDIDNNATLDVAGIIDNQGVINIQSENAIPGPAITLTEDAIISGGMINMTDDRNNRFFSADGLPHTLTLDGVAVSGSGRLGDGNLGFVSTGTIDFNGVEETQIQVDQTLGFLNLGHIRVAGGAFVNASFGPLLSPGTIVVEQDGLFVKSSGELMFDGSTFDVAGNFDANTDVTIDNGGTMNVSGLVQVGGPVTIRNSMLILDGGTVDGGATLDNSVARGEGFMSSLFAPSGRLEPGDGIGTVTVDFPDFRPDGVLAIEIGGREPGTGYDQLLLANRMFLSGQGTVEVQLVNGFMPEAGDAFVIVGQGAAFLPLIFDEFGTLDAPDISPLQWSLDYVLTDLGEGGINVTSIRLLVLCPADYNGDGATNSADFFDFLADFDLGDADFNGDGQTTSADLFDFLQAFSSQCDG